MRPLPVPAVEAPRRLSTLAIAPAQYVPRTNFATFAKDKLSGAAQGAAIGGGASAAFYAAAATNPYSMIIALFLTPVIIVSTTVAGAVGSMPGEKVQEIESAIESAVAKLDTQRALGERVSDTIRKENWIRFSAVSPVGPAAEGEAPAYAALQSAGTDAVLEVAIVEMGFQDSACGIRTGWNYSFCRGKTASSLMFFMRAYARLVRVTDGAELFASQFRYESLWREAAQWIANDAQLLAAEVNSGYRELAERIKDDALLVTPIALPTPGWIGADSGVCWLAPLSPPLERMNILQALMWRTDECTSLLSFAKVDSLRPGLRWTAFPRDVDRKDLDPTLLRRIRDVTYDLKIWEAARCSRGNLVYERSRLATPEHEVEEPLKPGQRYYWSFRARFWVDAQPMTTRWSRFDLNGCDSNAIDETKYHRFVTPK